MTLARTALGSPALRKFAALSIALGVAVLFLHLLSRPLPAAGALTPPSPRPDLLDRPHRPQGVVVSR